MVINRIASAFELRKTPAGKQALEEHEREITTEREVHVAAIEEAQARLHGLRRKHRQVAVCSEPLRLEFQCVLSKLHGKVFFACTSRSILATIGAMMSTAPR